MTILRSISYTILFIFLLSAIEYLFIIELFYFDIAGFNDDYEVYDFYYQISGFLNILIVLFWLRYLKDDKFFSISKTSFWYYLLAAALGVLFVFLQDPLNMFYNKIFDVERDIIWHLDNPEFYRLLWSSSFVTIFLVPIYEEFFFRKFIQKNLEQKTNAFLSILIASLLFSFIHMHFFASIFFDGNFLDVHHSYITLFGGLISGVLFYKSKSIGPSITMHCFWNLTVVVI